MIIYGPYMIIYGTYMIIYGPYMIIYGFFVPTYRFKAARATQCTLLSAPATKEVASSLRGTLGGHCNQSAVAVLRGCYRLLCHPTTRSCTHGYSRPTRRFHRPRCFKETDDTDGLTRRWVHAEQPFLRRSLRSGVSRHREPTSHVSRPTHPGSGWCTMKGLVRPIRG